VWLQYVAGSSGVSESSNNLRFQILAFKRKLLNCGVSVSDGAIYGEQSLRRSLRNFLGNVDKFC